MAMEQMQFTLSHLVAQAWSTVRNPQEGARQIINENLPVNLLWQMLALVVVGSVVLGQGAIILAAGDVDMSNPLMANPIAMGGLQAAVLVVSVFAIFWIGRAMGGTGSFEGSLALMIWLQFVMICLQVIQGVALILSPPLSDIIGLVGLVLFLWLLTNFISVLHGFRSLGLVFLMIIVSAFGIVFVLSLVLAILGFASPGDLNV